MSNTGLITTEREHTIDGATLCNAIRARQRMARRRAERRAWLGAIAYMLLGVASGLAVGWALWV